MAMNELADVTKTRSILCITVEDCNKHWRNFKLRMWRNPYPSEEPTIGQLSVMVELIHSGAIYVDFAIFGPHQQRTAKHMKSLGMIVGPKGGLAHAEFKPPSPPDYKHIRCSYDV